MKRNYIIALLLAGCFTSLTAQTTGKSWNLKQCIDYAVAHNITIKQQIDKQKQQELTLNTAKNSRLPGVNGSLDHSFNFGRGLTQSNTYTNRNTMMTGLQVGASVPLFTGKQIPNQIQLEEWNLKAATADLSKAKEDLSVNIASAYLQVLYEKELWQVARQQTALSRAQVELKEGFFKVGKAAESDVYEVKAQLAQDELEETKAENNYKLAILDLSQLLELPSPDNFEITEPEDDNIDALIPENPESIYRTAVTLKPSIKAEEFRLKGTDNSIRIARSGYMPQISLTAGLSTNYYNIFGGDNSTFARQMRDNFNKSIGISVSIPIFDRYATRNKIREAKIAQHAQQLALESVKKTLFKEIQQAYYNAVASQTQYRSSLTAEESARAAFTLMSKKYENQKATATEFKEAKTTLEKAESNRIQAKYDYIFRMKILNFYKGEALD